MSTTIPPFIESHVSGHNILFLSDKRELYIAGDNTTNKIGVRTTSTHLTIPTSIGIRLPTDENIVAFKSHPRNIFILTSKQQVIAVHHDDIGDSYKEYSIPEIRNTDVRIDVDPDEPISYNMRAGDLICHDFDFENNIVVIDHGQAPTVSISKGDLDAWVPLSQGAYCSLSEHKQRIYWECAKQRIETDLASDLEWVKSESVLALVFEQISHPIPGNSILEDSASIVETSYAVISPDRLPRVQLNIDSLQEIAKVANNYNINNIAVYRSKYAFPGSMSILYTNVEWVIFGSNTNLYKIRDEYVIEVFNYTSGSAPYSIINHARLPVKRYQRQNNCYVLCLPFKSTGVMTRHLLYFKQGNTHHVVIPHANSSHPVCWFYFESELEIDPENIHWLSYDYSILVVHNGIIYQYRYETQNLEEFMSCNVNHYIARQMYGSELFAYDNNWISSGLQLAAVTRECDLSRYKIEAVYNLRRLSDTYVVLYSNDIGLSTVSISNVAGISTIFFVCVKNLQYSAMIDYNAFIFIEDGYLHIINQKTVCNKVALPVAETLATSIELSATVILRTSDTVYYAHLYENFIFRAVSLIGLTFPTDIKAPLNLINKEQILSLQSSSSSCGDELNLSIHEPVLDIFLNFVSKIEVNSTPTLRCTSSTGTAVSSGARRMALTAVLKEFAAKYLINHNFLTSFNIQKLKQCSDSTLKNIAKTLVFCYNNIRCLPIRFPLSFLSAVQCRLPTTAALEHFANIEDPQAFRNLLQIKDNEKELRNAGAANYHQALCFICKFDESADAKAIICKLAKAFLANVHPECQIQMNLPTFDWCLSGEYKIDPEDFIKYVSIDTNLKNYRDDILNYIRNLDPEKMKRLLLNWSGTTVFYRHGSYRFTTNTKGSSSPVYFATCSRTICVPLDFMQICHKDSWDSIFLVECLHMKD